MRHADTAVSRSGLIARIRQHKLARELASFGSVGAIAYVVDFGVFNILRNSLLEDAPVTAKVISVAVATLVAWLGNRHLTYAGRARTSSSWAEFQSFAIINVIGLGIAAACLGFSHYVLGYTSQLADNISGQVVGVGLGTIFRWMAYRWWLFPENSTPHDGGGASDSSDHAPTSSSRAHD